MAQTPSSLIDMVGWSNNLLATASIWDILGAIVLLTIISGFKKKGGSNAFLLALFRKLWK